MSDGAIWRDYALSTLCLVSFSAQILHRVMVTPGELRIFLILVLADHLIYLMEVSKVNPFEKLRFAELATG